MIAWLRSKTFRSAGRAHYLSGRSPRAAALKTALHKQLDPFDFKVGLFTLWLDYKRRAKPCLSSENSLRRNANATMFHSASHLKCSWTRARVRHVVSAMKSGQRALTTHWSKIRQMCRLWLSAQILERRLKFWFDTNSYLDQT